MCTKHFNFRFKCNVKYTNVLIRMVFCYTIKNLHSFFFISNYNLIYIFIIL